MFSGVGVVSGLLVVAREQKRNIRCAKMLYVFGIFSVVVSVVVVSIKCYFVFNVSSLCCY